VNPGSGHKHINSTLELLIGKKAAEEETKPAKADNKAQEGSREGNLGVISSNS